MDKPPSRREFLKSVTALGAAALPASGAVAHGGPESSHHARDPQPEGYLFLTAPEAAFLDAAVARLIPKDDLGPGAREAGVTCYIDRQLAGTHGTHSRAYRQGPWFEGTPEQGYQLPLNPQQVYRAAIAETNAHCRSRWQRDFSELDAPLRDEVLAALESGAIELDTVPASTFFAMLWNQTVEGFFADPLYGGNRDKVGWRLIGFPGVAAAYIDLIGRHGARYEVAPASIVDVQQGRVPVDAHGHPRHAPEPPRGRSRS